MGVSSSQNWGCLGMYAILWYKGCVKAVQHCSYLELSVCHCYAMRTQHNIVVALDYLLVYTYFNCPTIRNKDLAQP